MDIIHGLVQIACSSCLEQKALPTTEQSNSVSEEQAYAKDAALILYNLASFDRPKFYIPGETVRQAKDRRRFILWGGLFGLYYLSVNTKVKEISELCETTKLKEFELRDHEDLVKVLKLYTESLKEDSNSKEKISSRNDPNTVATAQTHKLSEEEKPEGATAEIMQNQDEQKEAALIKPVNLDTSAPQDVVFPEYFLVLKMTKIEY